MAQLFLSICTILISFGLIPLVFQLTWNGPTLSSLHLPLITFDQALLIRCMGLMLTAQVSDYITDQRGN